MFDICQKRIRLALLSALSALLFSHAAWADRHRAATPLLPKYQQECAACHVAYPPGLLPAESWQRILGDLSHHYGTNAALDAATIKELATWLKANAGRRAAPPQDRISRSPWFIHEHDELTPAVWQSPNVRSAANCAACHTLAEQGDYDERNIRIPRR